MSFFNTSNNNGILSRISNGVTDTFNQFNQPTQYGISGQPTGFLQTNTIIAKFVFLIIVIIGFLFLLNLGINFMNYLFAPTDNPYLVYGLQDGHKGVIIPQDPNASDFVPILRSNNEDSGIEFTWSVWLNISDIAIANNLAPIATAAGGGNEEYSSGANLKRTYQHIFNKGDRYYNVDTGVASVNNAPGVYLSTKTNQIRIMMNTIESTPDYIDVDNVPIKKWFHLAVRMKNTIMDVYINGVIAQRKAMTNLPKQNYEDLNICQNGGFAGNLSNLRYYRHALNVFELNSIVNYGPNMMSSDDNKNKYGDSHYLSKYWYSYNK